MKFALNGALTVGTWGGANIEITESVGHENIFIFCNRAEQVAEMRGKGYRPRDFYESDFDLRYAIDRLAEGAFSPEQPDRYRELVNNLLETDHYQLLADYADYVACQDNVDDLYRRPGAWTRNAILNVAGMGPFSSDRTTREYASEIWGIQPVDRPPSRPD